MSVMLAGVGASADYEFDWADEIPIGVDLTDVVHQVPAELSLVQEITDTVNKRSIARVSGGVHGGRYVVTALATLSNGEQIPASLTRYVFYGAAA